MSNRTILAATLGFISAISRSILSVATLGLLQVEEEDAAASSGGGSGKVDNSGQSDAPHFFSIPMPASLEVAVLAVASGLVM